MKNTPMSVRLTIPEREVLAKSAQEAGNSISAHIRHLLSKALEPKTLANAGGEALALYRLGLASGRTEAEVAIATFFHQIADRHRTRPGGEVWADMADDAALAVEKQRHWPT